MNKTLFASAISALFFSTALVGIGSASADELVIAPLGVVVRDGAAVNANVAQIAPVLSLQAIKKIDIDKVGGDLDLSNQTVGNNVDITALQKVDQVNVAALSSGGVAGGQIVGPIKVKDVTGNVSIGQTTVGNNVSVDLKKPAN
jgi:hypothetical protein